MDLRPADTRTVCNVSFWVGGEKEGFAICYVWLLMSSFYSVLCTVFHLSV